MVKVMLSYQTEEEKKKYINLLSKGSKVLNVSKPYEGKNGNKKIYIRVQ